mgnify:CR=1 FL=1
MGLGPHQTSLLARIAAPAPVWSNPFAMQMEVQERGEARREKAQWHRQKHAAQRKPEAPVLPLGKAKGQERGWLWNGESMPSKGLHNGHAYTAAQVRKAGFKLPVLRKQNAKAEYD